MVLAIPVIGEEVRQRQRGIITGHLRRQMIPRPRIAVIVNAGNVLVSDELGRNQRGRITQRLPVAGQVIPVRHVDLIAALRGAFVIVRRPHDDAGLKQVGFLRRALQYISGKLCRNDDVCELCFCHNSDLFL